jgi:phosphoribosylanthranilate isomerase
VVILLDAHDPVRHGGTGRSVDWNLARTVAGERRTILAGGLTPTNVARAVQAVRPFGVDVSSGVESSPGVKDAMRLKCFFEALND